MTDVSIIGAGPAGLTAGIYLLRAGLKVNIFEKNLYGGQMSLTNRINNYPGFMEITGGELSNIMHEQVKKFGGNFIFEEVKSVNLFGNDKIVETANNKYSSTALIIANGLKRRKLNCAGETEFTGNGVSYCATCDGNFFKNKKVAVVGGGNTALEDALYLAKICKSVYIIVRKGYFIGEKYLVELAKKTNNITLIMYNKISKIYGENVVKYIEISNVLDNTVKILDVSGIFISIGYEPNNDIFKHQLKLDELGYLVSDENCSTNIDGVYVAGDSRKKTLRQIVTATSDGAIAANRAIQFIKKLSIN